VSAVATEARRPAPPATPAPRVRKRRRRITSYLLPVLTGVIILYLASPVFVMILYGFNAVPGERNSPHFFGFTLDWYRNLFDVPGLTDALWTSISVAFLCAPIATVLGTLIGLALGRYPFRGRGATNFVIFLAIAVPEIVLGSSLLSMFVEVNEQRPLGLTAPLGFGTILLSHIGFSVAFVAVVVRARVSGLDRALENAAQDLYATPMQAFWKVTFPLILPGIVGGFLLAFVLSLDDFVITNFVSGQKQTFPIWVFGATRIGLPPQVNVMGTLLFAVGILVAALNVILGSRAQRAAKSSVPESAVGVALSSGKT
jgi:spermidine/putrescine transport system permease protein